MVRQKTNQWKQIKGYPLYIKVTGFSFEIHHESGNKVGGGSATRYEDFIKNKRETVAELKTIYPKEI